MRVKAERANSGKRRGSSNPEGIASVHRCPENASARPAGTPLRPKSAPHIDAPAGGERTFEMAVRNTSKREGGVMNLNSIMIGSENPKVLADYYTDVFGK